MGGIRMRQQHSIDLGHAIDNRLYISEIKLVVPTTVQ